MESSEMKETTNVYGEESWTISTDSVEAAISVSGGMMAPVLFTLADGRVVEPYYVNPWYDEDHSAIVPSVLKPLRGDFFCLPFGGVNDRGVEHHQPHGESAWARWGLIERKAGCLRAAIRYTAGGRVEKSITLGISNPVIYTEHRISGFEGTYPLGHHAILHGAAPDDDASTPIWHIMTKPFDLGITEPGYTSPTAAGEYYALDAGARFDRLETVPTRWKSPETTDCSFFPAREGFIDLLAWFRRPANEPAWTIAVNLQNEYAWFSIKDPQTLPATVMWMENRGRHGAPWSGRNSCIGIEETCSYFAAGLAQPEDGGTIGAAGIPVAHHLRPDSETVIRTIQGVFPFPDVERRIVELRMGTNEVSFVDDRADRYTMEIDVSRL